MLFDLRMNPPEMVLALLADIAFFAYMLLAFRSWKFAAAIGILTAIPLCISIERTSQFLTVDEIYIVRETIDLAKPDVNGLSQWMQGLMKTTEIAYWPVLAGIQKILSVSGLPLLTDTQNIVFLKCLHWLTGFAVLLWIHFLLDRHFVPAEGRRCYVSIFIVTMLLLPTNNLSLKIYNYDLLSMLLGMVSFLYLLLALKHQNIKDSILGVVIGLLAAQEKLIAAPILVLSFIVTAYLFGLTAQRRRYGWTIFGLLVAIAIAVLLSLVCAWGVATLRQWNLPEGYWERVADPFVGWAWRVVGFVVGGSGEASSPGSQLPILSVAAIVMLGLVSLGLLAVHDFLLKRGVRLAASVGQLSTPICTLGVVVLIVGIISTFTITAYWAPFQPIPQAYYHPTASFNGITLHYGAVSGWQHLAFAVGRAYAVFVDAMPTVIWLALGGALLVAGRAYQHRISITPELFLLIGLLVPAMHGAALMPVGNKYLNLWLLLTVIAVTLKAVDALSGLHWSVRLSAVVLYGILMILEVVPFGPLYASFRPIWAEYKDPDRPVVGTLNPSWVGWGEETMLAGQTIQDKCRLHNNNLDGIPCDTIVLYYAYPGEWLDENMGIRQVRPFWFQGPPPDPTWLSYTASDYYVINRSAAIQELVDLPPGVDPVFVISFRGFTQAWVYRGDQLAAGGCKFVMSVRRTECAGTP